MERGGDGGKVGCGEVVVEGVGRLYRDFKGRVCWPAHGPTSACVRTEEAVGCVVC